jgi:hypothetical protein
VGKVVDTHAGDDGCTLCLVLIVGNDGICGIGLGALKEVGKRVGHAHSVFQNIVADLQRLKKVLKFGFAHGDSSLCV